MKITKRTPIYRNFERPFSWAGVNFPFMCVSTEPDYLLKVILTAKNDQYNEFTEDYWIILIINSKKRIFAK